MNTELITVENQTKLKEWLESEIANCNIQIKGIEHYLESISSDKENNEHLSNLSKQRSILLSSLQFKKEWLEIQSSRF
jgi:hypothetical protein